MLDSRFLAGTAAAVNIRMLTIVVSLVLTLVGIPSAMATSSYKYEVSGQFRALAPNAGGIPVIGASFKYRWFEGSAAYNAAIGFIAGAAYRIDFGEENIFVPHISLGLPMLGPGFNIRILKLFGAHFGLRFDSYAFLYLPSFQLEPLLNLGVSCAF